MSKRLQVVLEDAEYRDMQRAARRAGMTMSQWVRDALRAMRRRTPTSDAGKKVSAVREAAGYSYPTADIDQMLNEIEKGYLGGP